MAEILNSSSSPFVKLFSLNRKFYTLITSCLFYFEFIVVVYESKVINSTVIVQTFVDLTVSKMIFKSSFTQMTIGAAHQCSPGAALPTFSYGDGLKLATIVPGLKCSPRGQWSEIDWLSPGQGEGLLGSCPVISGVPCACPQASVRAAAVHVALIQLLGCS